MLQAMAKLKLSGSFTGAIYQEQVLYSLLVGDTIHMRKYSHQGERGKGSWVAGKKSDTLLSTSCPALLFAYEKDSRYINISEATYIGPFANATELATKKQNPQVWAM